MRIAIGLLGFICALGFSTAQDKPNGPTDEKAKKTFEHALQSVRERKRFAALDDFKKADKQDGGHCKACQEKMVEYGLDLQDWNVAETGAGEMVANAQGPTDTALARYQLGAVFMREGTVKHKPELYSRAHDEFAKALASAPKFPAAIYGNGFALAQLKQDDSAKAQFEQFVKMRPTDDPQRQRALRFISEPDLARARMAPPFALTTSNGQRISLDDLQGKVVLIDFWATWCRPCREALPHVQ